MKSRAVPLDFYYTLSTSVERSCWPCNRWCVTVNFKSWTNDFLLAQASRFRLVLNCSSLSLISFSGLLVWWALVFGMTGYKSLSLGLAFSRYFNNNNNKKNSFDSLYVFNLPYIPELTLYSNRRMTWGFKNIGVRERSRTGTLSTLVPSCLRRF